MPGCVGHKYPVRLADVFVIIHVHLGYDIQYNVMESVDPSCDPASSPAERSVGRLHGEPDALLLPLLVVRAWQGLAFPLSPVLFLSFSFLLDNQGFCRGLDDGIGGYQHVASPDVTDLY